MCLTAERIKAHINPDREYPPLPIRMRVSYRPVQKWETANPYAKLAAHRPKWKTIQREVCEKHQITLSELIGPDRKRMFAWPRQEAMWRCRTETNMSHGEIGRRFGDRDHTTVIHGVRAHAKRTGAPLPL